MRSFSVTVIVAASLAIATAQSSRKPEKDSEPPAGSDDKRGFIVTPLSALPASAVAPLLPYLRAASDAAKTQPTEQLPGVLAATAPLAAERAAAEAPVVVATPVAKVVTPTPVISAKFVVPKFLPVLPPQPVVPSLHPYARLTSLALPATSYSFSYNGAYPALSGYRYPFIQSSLVI